MQARYFSSTQGRFTSVDPFNIVLEAQAEAETNPQKAQAALAAYLSQPQQWNRYTYAINNPLLYVDPTGEAIQLSNNKEERERQLKALQEAVGPEAGKIGVQNAVQVLIRQGRLPAQKVGRDYVIFDDDLKPVREREPGIPLKRSLLWRARLFKVR